MSVPWKALGAVLDGDVKVSEIEHGPLKLRRRCRIVTYIVAKDSLGCEIEIEVSDGAAQAVIDAIRLAREVKQ